MKQASSWIKRLTLIALTMQIFGCAWMSHQPADKIYVRSLDPKARLYVDGDFVGMGIGSTTVKRDKVYTIAAKEDGCATTIVDTRSKFTTSSVSGLLNGAPLLAAAADGIGFKTSDGQASPTTYTVTPVCPPAASPLLM